MGTIIVGGTTTIELELDNTTLWYMRLRHMGERGMMELHKRKLLKGIKTCKLELCKCCVLGGKKGCSSRQPHIRQKRFLIMFIQTFGG